MEIKADRIAIIIVFMLIGALAYGWLHNNQRIVAANQERIDRFISAGERFTAKDGKVHGDQIRDLFEQVKELRDKINELERKDNVRQLQSCLQRK